jgi:hypothetical protein
VPEGADVDEQGLPTLSWLQAVSGVRGRAGATLAQHHSKRSIIAEKPSATTNGASVAESCDARVACRTEPIVRCAAAEGVPAQIHRDHAPCCLAAETSAVSASGCGTLSGSSIRTHCDHAGGIARLARVTGAQVIAGAPDARLLARGGRDDPQYGDRYPFPPVRVTLRLGDLLLTAHPTPAHTKGSFEEELRTQRKNAASARQKRP